MSGIPTLIVYAKTMYNSYFAGEAPTIARAKGAILHLALDDDTGVVDMSTGRFCRILITDARIADLEAYIARWKQQISWTVNSHDPVTDTYNLTLTCTNPGTSGEGNLLANQVSDVVAKWGGTLDIANSTPNNIIINITGFAAITSEAFFGNSAIAAVGFAEDTAAYDSATFTHKITADYSKLGVNPSNVEKLLKSKGATILSNSNKTIVYTMASTVAADAFKTDLQNCARDIKSDRYAVPATAVDSAVANGGDLSATLAQLQGQVIDQSA